MKIDSGGVQKESYSGQMGNTASKIHEWFESQLSFGGIHNINSTSKVNLLIVKIIECLNLLLHSFNILNFKIPNSKFLEQNTTNARWSFGKHSLIY